MGICLFKTVHNKITATHDRCIASLEIPSERRTNEFMNGLLWSHKGNLKGIQRFVAHFIHLAKFVFFIKTFSIEKKIIKHKMFHEK